jgi:glycosyltransferase involved in cell wall biosynthesis
VLTTVADVPPQPGVTRALTADDASAVSAVLGSWRPDVVSAWNLARVPQRQLLAPIADAGIPLVLVACDAWLAESDPAVPAAAPGSAVVFVSADLRDRVVLPAWAPRDTEVVATGIDTEIFVPAPRPPRPWRGRLLYVGRLAPEKGVLDAVDALAVLPEATLRVVAADRPDRWAALREDVARRGLENRVSSTTADRPQLVAEYESADAVLFPSRWREPFGLVPLEAMACATPVIATGTGGSASYLEDGANALLVPAGDPGALAAAVEKLAGDPDLRALLVAGGLATCRHHTADRTADLLAVVHRRASAAR